MRRATKARGVSDEYIEISIHALREEGDLEEQRDAQANYIISIHALREEGDMRAFGAAYCRHISIHALREEGDASKKI